MGQKVNPIGFRLGGVYSWSSRWFLKHGQAYREALRQDATIRKFLRTRLKDAGLARIDIERSVNTLTVTLHCAKPGLIIGRGGQGAEALRAELRKLVGSKVTVSVNIQEIERANLSAALAVQAVVADIEKRIPFRRSIKSVLNRLNKAGAEGAKIVISGRLDGSEIARTEKVAQGKIPLHTIRAAVDYSRGAAFTTYGVVGVKVWVFGGAPLGRRSEEPIAGEPVARPHRRRQSANASSFGN